MTAYTDNGINLNPGQCHDFYYEIEITRTNAAYDTSRNYTITASADGGITGSTPAPRQIYVEHLVSQFRNSTLDMKLDGASIPVGGTMELVVGNTYTITLDSKTATNGYNQIEEFINFPNTIFQVLSVSTTYSADSSPYVSNPDNKLYADACLWDNNPNSLSYRSCIGVDGKAGGNVTNVYTVKVIGGAGTSGSLNTLIYDFSGSSYHYNSDFSTNTRIFSVSSPVTVSKSFSPASFQIGEIPTPALTFSIRNTSGSALTGVSISDTLPQTPGTMQVETTTTTTTGCGPATLTAIQNSTSVSLVNATIAAGGTCSFVVPVKVSVAGIYANTSGPVFINGASTGQTASANLAVSTAPSGSCDLVLAKWSMEPSQGISIPPQPIPFIQSSLVPTATASVSNGLTQTINDTTGSAELNSWQGNGRYGNSTTPTTGQYFLLSVDTRNYYGINLSFNVRHLASGDPRNYAVYYGPTPIEKMRDGAITISWTGISPRLDFTSQTSTSGITNFYIYGYNQPNNGTGRNMLLDDIIFTGCSSVSVTKPTLSKGFSPNPIGPGGVSTLTFNLGNYNASYDLSNVSFTDSLPAGVQVAPTPNVSTTSCGSPAWAPVAGATSLSFSGASIVRNSTCTVKVDVIAANPGTYHNTSGFISSTETGTNTGSDGFASATLNVLTRPQFGKKFSPNPIYPGQVSTLTFLITNPNSVALSGIGFTDFLPAIAGPNQMVVAPVPNTSNTCGGTLTANAGTNSISLAGGTLAANGSCEIKVDVTAPAAGIYVNTTSTLSTGTSGLTAPAATDTLAVITTHPSLTLNKSISTSSNGPWSSYVTTPVGGSIFYRFIIENTGDVPFTNISLFDLGPTAVNLSSCSWSAILPAGSSEICMVGPIAAVNGTQTNSAQAHGTYNSTTYDSNIDSAVYATSALSLAKVADPTTFTSIGDVITYTYTLTNNGASNLTSPYVITDDKISAISCASATSPLLPGASTTCTGTYTITDVDIQNGSVINIASATANGITSNYARATVTYTVPSADLAVTKSNGVDSVTAGGTTTYTVRVSNGGPSSVTGAILTDPAATGLSKTAVTCSAAIGNQCSTAPTIAQLQAGFTLPALALNGFYEITISADVTATSGTVSNTATVAAPTGTTDPDLTNNSATDTDTVPSADLAVTKSNGVDSVTAGGTTTYTVRVSNGGPSSVTGAILTDPAATGLSKTAVTCSAAIGNQCSTAPTIAQLQAGFTLPALALNGFYEITISADVTATSGTVSNTATVAAPTGTTDPDLTNNSATDTDTVPSADLAVTKSNGVDSVTAGGTTTYTVRVSNGGPSSVTGAILTDPAATGLSKTAVTCSAAIGNQCSTAPTIAQLQAGFTLPALALNGFYEITISADVTATSGTVSNTATVAAPTGTTDPDLTNNSATDTDTVPSADLAVTKSNGVDSVTAGGTTTYTVRVSNGGPSSVTGAILTDPAATGLSKTAVTCSAAIGNQCSTAPTIAQLQAGFTLPALALNGFYEITISADVTATSGTVSNTATVAAPTGTTDPDLTNNSATDTDTVPSADLAVTKSNGVDSVTAGGTTTYTVRVSNGGPSSVTGAILTDPAATGLSKTAVTCSAAIGNQCSTAPTIAQLQAGFTLPALALNGFYEITISADVTATSGTVSNTATVAAPTGTTDPDLTNNSATDTDTVPSADLAVTKSNGVDSVTAGGTTTYTVRVSNGGPSSVTGAILTDPAATGLSKTAVTCSAAIGNQCSTAPTIAQLQAGFTLPALALMASMRSPSARMSPPPQALSPIPPPSLPQPAPPIRI